ncbi:MAG: ATP-binding cassette domain-containing protein [Bacilli bacterium]|nr:ATP-binding cassette domain-containing protein [Bacilli bacterium]
MLIAKDIKKIYPGNSNYSLEDFSYSFGDSGLYLITGPSGSGKTTLLGILSGIDSQFEGELSVNSSPIAGRRRTEYRNKLSSIVFQDVNFINRLSVEDNLRIAFDLAKEPFSGEKCGDVLMEVNLPDGKDDLHSFLKKRPSELSGGQKQRLAIARSLIKKSKILFLDEPTSALDEINAKEIIRILYRLSETTLIVVVSHLPDYFFLDSFSPKDVIEVRDGKANARSFSKEERSSDDAKWQISSVSNRSAFKVAASSIFSSKLRLFFSGLITILSLVAFTFLSAARHIDRNEVLLKAQLGIDQRISLISNNLTQIENGVESIQGSPFTNKQQEKLSDFKAHNVFYGNLSIKGCIDEKYHYSSYNIPLLNYLLNDSLTNHMLELWSENDPNFVLDGRLEGNEVAHFPKEHYEIAISSIFADAILSYGSEKNGFKIESVGELIGKKIGHFSISTIYETKDYPLLKRLIDAETDDDAGIMLSQNPSYSKLLYASPGFFDYWMSLNPYAPFNPGSEDSIRALQANDDQEVKAASYYAFEYADASKALDFVNSLSISEGSTRYSAGLLSIYSNSFDLDEIMKTNAADYFSFGIIIFMLLAVLSLLQLFSSNIAKERYSFGVLLSLGCGPISLIKISLLESSAIMIGAFLGTILISLAAFSLYNSVLGIPLLNIGLISIITLLSIIIGIGSILTLFGTIKSSRTNISVLLKNRN